MKKNDRPIYVTRPNLPPLEKLQPSLEKIWANKLVTNDGPFHQEFEKQLALHLGVDHVSLIANGTLALVIGLQALRITGEVITTPFTFVATTHALRWNGITPVFCDIDAETLNIDPERIEAAITPKTTAILAVHVYGHPCDVDAIQSIAEKYGLAVMYDAAHAFDVKVEGKSIVDSGDLSILSFHGTKLFTTFEGGAIICHSEKVKKRIDFLKNFGIADEITVTGPGINGKMNEFQSAVGLLSLDIVREEIQRREVVANRYRSLLEHVKGIRVFLGSEGVSDNHAYYPILIDRAEFGVSRNQVYEELKKYNVFARRYFYPLVSDMPSYRGLPSATVENLPVAHRAAESVICLPMYGSLELDVVDGICEVIESLGRGDA